MKPFEGWENFYVIVGSSAGALIGLQFVVITLIAETPVDRNDADASQAFATPSVVHFAVVLLLSALVSVPWDGLGTIAVLWALVGLSGLIYLALVAHRMRRQTAYKPVREDWLAHVVVPGLAYATLAGSAFAASSQIRTALFLVGGASLLLLFTGIHNAWDAVTYHVFFRRRERRQVEPRTDKKD